MDCEEETEGDGLSGYMAVRHSRDGYDFIDTSTFSTCCCLHSLEKSDAADAAIPEWAKDNPVTGMAKVHIIIEMIDPVPWTNRHSPN